MAWTGVITNKGNELLNRWVEGKTLTIDGAATGAGRVQEVALLAQSGDVKDRKQTASIVSGTQTPDGYKVKLQITAPEEAYNLAQYGVFAHIDAEAQTLLAIFQSNKDIPIPSSTETPDFIYTFYAILAFSNEGKLELNIDTSALTSQSTVEGMIEEGTADLVKSADFESYKGEISGQLSTMEETLNDTKSKADKAEKDISAHTSNTDIHVTAEEKASWSGKQDKLTFDTEPKADSTNPVESKGIKSALDGKASREELETKLDRDDLVTVVETIIDDMWEASY